MKIPRFIGDGNRIPLSRYCASRSRDTFPPMRQQSLHPQEKHATRADRIEDPQIGGTNSTAQASHPNETLSSFHNQGAPRRAALCYTTRHHRLHKTSNCPGASPLYPDELVAQDLQKMLRVLMNDNSMSHGFSAHRLLLTHQAYACAANAQIPTGGQNRVRSPALP